MNRLDALCVAKTRRDETQQDWAVFQNVDAPSVFEPMQWGDPRLDERVGLCDGGPVPHYRYALVTEFLTGVK